MSQVQAWLGGTFDPVHNGHLRVALDVAEALQTSQLSLLPCNVPPHQKQPLFNASQREAMLALAVATDSALCVDSRELQRSGPSYTVDTLTELRNELGEHPLCWVMGYDSFASLPSWNRWQSIFELTHLVVCDRPGATQQLPAKVAAELASRQVSNAAALQDAKAGKIWRFQPTQLQISATDLRERIQHKRSLRYLVPESVAAKIEEFTLEPSP